MRSARGPRFAGRWPLVAVLLAGAGPVGAQGVPAPAAAGPPSASASVPSAVPAADGTWPAAPALPALPSPAAAAPAAAAPAAEPAGPPALPAGQESQEASSPAEQPADPPVSAAPASAAQLGTLPGLVDEAIRRLAEAQNAKALRLAARKDYPAALDGFRGAYALDPGDPEITNNLAYMYHLLGSYEAAERLYRETLALDPERGVAHLNFADLLSVRGATQEGLAEAAEHLTRARELRGNEPRIILRQARVATRRGRFAEAERHYRELLARRSADDELRLEIGDFYRDYGRMAEALAWYREVRGALPPGGRAGSGVPGGRAESGGREPQGAVGTGRLPSPEPARSELFVPSPELSDGEDAGRLAAQRIWEIEISSEARRLGWLPRTEAAPGNVHALAARGRILFNQGRFEDAERLLREAVALAPAHSPARSDLGDLLSRTGREQEAEVEYLRGVALDHGNAETTARLGDLYMGWKGGGRAAEAALFFERALTLRPDWTALHLKLAEAYRAAGDLPRALFHLDRFLPTAGSDAERERAQALRRALLPLLQGAPAAGTGATAAAGPEPAPGGGEPDRALVDTLNRARALLGRGEPEAAMAELRRLKDEQRLPAILNLEGQILYAAGHPQEAAAAWARSLELEEAQGEVHEQLGLVQVELGQAASGRRHLLRAEDLGDQAASYHLARLALVPAEPAPLGWLSDLRRLRGLWGARDRLSRFLERGRSPMQLDDARRLEAQVASRLSGALGFGALLVLLAAAGLGGLAFRLWGGSDLRQLIARHPEAGPDVQRILSAIRHEVLKHNTLVLTGLAEALERGCGEDVAEKAAYCRDSLFGTPAVPGGAAGQLGEYVAELERLGRSHGRRLNLRRKDPALSALLRGFSLLARAAPLLGRAARLGTRARHGLVRQLRQAARLLNQQGYEAVRGLLDELRVLRVDRTLLQGIYERTCREPAFQGLKLAPLVLELAVEMPCAVLVPRQAFEDILANLLRNALQSSLRHGAAEVTVGIAVQSEVDPITGIERIVFLIHDRSPQVLTTEMIRGRYIEEGLGLAADLVSRYDGTLDVLPGHDGWAKAVAVKLPRVERPPVPEAAQASGAA